MFRWGKDATRGKKLQKGPTNLKKFFEIKIMLNIWIGKVVFQNKR